MPQMYSRAGALSITSGEAIVVRTPLIWYSCPNNQGTQLSDVALEPPDIELEVYGTVIPWIAHCSAVLFYEEGGFMVTEVIADALSITQAARRLGLSSERVRQLCNAGELESFRFGPGWRLIPVEAVEELARARAARRNLELSNGGQD